MSPNPRQLEDYRRKRDPGRTPEPFGPAEGTAAAKAAAQPRPGMPPRFVVQKHWARNMHFDLRLELDGTLKSWAVPRGPSTKVEEKRLAVHVEDHPLEYANFEGMIPAGNYGAGSVIVWDRGYFGTFKDGEDLLEQYERGKMELELFGFKLRGRWTLVKMSKSEKEWLLLKKADGGASEVEAIDRYPESVISGLTVEEMRDPAGTIAAVRDRIEELKAPKKDLTPKQVPLTLATRADKPPSGSGWAFEIKYDGVRVLASRKGDEVQLISRSGEDITARYPEVAEAIGALAAPHFLFDGEIIAEDESGRPNFGRLQARMGLNNPHDIEVGRVRVPVRGMFFDCLGLEGYDLRGLPLVQRKELLTRVLPPLGMVQRCDHIVEHGDAFFEAAAKLGLEGIVAKQLQSKYAGRRTQDWVKVKCDRRDFFVIGGYTEPKGSRAQFGALHFGRYEGDQLVYVSKVGTGFDGAKLDEISKMLAPLKRATSPFTVATPTGKGHFWVEPKLVCEIRYTEWTHEGGLRHPTFMRMAPERKPEECRPEEILKIEAEDGAADESKIENGAGAEGAKRKSRKKASAKAASSSKGSAEKSAEASLSEISPSSASGPTATERFRAAASAEKIVRLSNLKKVFWPAEGYNKGDLISYYETVAPLLLPYLRNRPLVLTRYPDGIDGKSFFQKDAPVYVPDWIRTETIWSEDTKRDIKYFVVDDVESLRYVANMGTIPMHIWAAQVGSLENPDWLVIDLDPKEAPFVHVVQVARALKKILDELELPGYIKTSGKTGLHVLIPMGQQYSDDEVRAFARLIAMLTVESVPEISTVARMIKGRGGKVYVDFGQNGYGITIVAPYSLRPLPGAPASCPLRWDEVTARLDPANYTIQSLPKRFEKMDDPMVPVLGEGVDMASAIEKIQRRMESGS